MFEYGSPKNAGNSTVAGIPDNSYRDILIDDTYTKTQKSEFMDSSSDNRGMSAILEEEKYSQLVSKQSKGLSEETAPN